MQSNIIDNFKQLVLSIENFCARFYQPILGIIFLFGVLLQGVAGMVGLFSVLGCFWLLLTLTSYLLAGKAERLLVTLGILLLSSFVLSGNVPFLVSLGLAMIGSYSIFFGQKDFEFVRNSESAFYFQLIFVGVFLWGGVRHGHQVLMIDNYHPFYELGIGRCVEWGNWLSSWLPRDMAYLDGTVRFHFLATRLPYLFSYLGRVDKFVSIAFFVPAVFLWISAVVADVFKVELSWLNGYGRRLILIGLLAGGSAVVPSVGVGTVLAFLAILLLGRGNFFAAVPALLLLLLTKFTFFVVIFSGWGMTCCWSWFISKKFPLKSFLAGCVTFIIGGFLYVHFLSGAHPHCLWLPLPWIFVNPFRPHFLTQSRPFDFFELLVIVLQMVGGLWLFKKAYEKAVHAIALISMCFVAGLSWRYFLLSEFVEGNNFQFVTLNEVFFLIMLLFLVSPEGIATLYRSFNITLNQCCKKIFEFSCKAAVALKAGGAFLQGVMLPLKATIIFLLMGQGNSTDIQSIKAWSFLESRRDFYGVVSGKHYEIRGSYSHDSDLPGDRGFLASGFSGKQLFCEGYCSRGVMMNVDYPVRVAHVLVLFKKFVLLGEASQESFKKHFDDIEYLQLPAYPMSQSPSGMIRMLHKLTLGREWHRVNYEKKLYQEMMVELDRIQDINDIRYFLDYFKSFNIRYMVLEEGDKPAATLMKYADVIYKNDTTQVLWLK